MEVVLVIALAALGVWWFALREPKKNTGGTFDAPYKVEAPKEAETPAATSASTPAPAWHTAPPEGTKPLPIPNPLDVNHDGKVNMEDVKEAVKKTRAGVKKAVAAATTDSKAVKKTAKTAPAPKTRAKAATKKTSKK